VDVSIVVVNYNTGHLLLKALASVRAAQGTRTVQIVIVDNASRDDSCQVLRDRFPDCRVIENTVNIGFGRAVNQAFEHVQGKYVLLLNPDAVVVNGLHESLSFMDSDLRCGVLGARLVGADGRLQPSCRYFPRPWNVFLSRTGLSRLFPGARLVDDMEWDHASARECDWVPGCYYLIRKEVIDRVGLFDPRYFLYYEEVDHCRAVKAAGWTVMYHPGTTVVHVGGESAKSDSVLTSVGRQISELQVESELLYFRKHHGIFGLGAATLLEHVAVVYQGLKSLLRHADARGAWGHLRRVAMFWRLLVATNLATRPTR
jgi:N-acetylglucosaminyl-diphospho-decaprenol L-rhamnosyltransferase